MKPVGEMGVIEMNLAMGHGRVPLAA